MVIINRQGGQLANRLWGFSSFIANSIEYKYELVNRGFSRYSSFFEATSKHQFGGHPIFTNRANIPFVCATIKDWSNKITRKQPTFCKYYRISDTHDERGVIFDLNSPEFIADVQRRKILVEGWMFRDLINVRKHRDKLICFFTPVEPYRSEYLRELDQVSNLADVLIGVHIRRGDYAEYTGGKWHYSDNVYANMMHQLSELYASEGKSSAFLICSNEEIDKNKYIGLNISYRPRHFVVDLYCLSGCDAIIGPPSTYSQWAAFYGNKPLTMLLEANQKISIPMLNASLLPETDFPEKEPFRFVI